MTHHDWQKRHPTWAAIDARASPCCTSAETIWTGVEQSQRKYAISQCIQNTCAIQVCALSSAFDVIGTGDPAPVPLVKNNASRGAVFSGCYSGRRARWHFSGRPGERQAGIGLNDSMRARQPIRGGGELRTTTAMTNDPDSSSAARLFTIGQGREGLLASARTEKECEDRSAAMDNASSEGNVWHTTKRFERGCFTVV